MKKVLLIHGPNLNLTGQREPGIYGSDTLAAINAEVVAKCERLGMSCAVFQSNVEGALIDRIHAAREDCAGHHYQRGRVYALQLRASGCDRVSAPALCGGPHVQRACARGVPAQIGHRAGVRGRDRGLRQAQLPAGCGRGQGDHRVRRL